MTNVNRMVVRWVSHYLVCLVVNWWSRPLWSVLPRPHSIHTLRPESPVPSPARGWLTFDGWQADGSRCRRGTSSAWFHSASPPPSNLVNNIKCWSSIKNVSVCDMCSLSLSLTHVHNALLFIRFNSLSHTQTHFTPPSSPLISLVNLTRCESVRGRGCSSMLWMSSTSHMNWMTGWAL